MKTKDLKAFADLAESMGYEVQPSGSPMMMPGGAPTLTSTPDGKQVIQAETITIVLVKKTVYEVAAEPKG
jgi:hypothetical protein